MGTDMMSYWGWGQAWYDWLIPAAVLVLAAWILIRIARRYQGRQG